MKEARYMKLFQLFLLLLILSCSILSVSAQDIITDQNGSFSKQETEVLEQILIDAKKLKLPQNRAWVYSQVGKFLWKIDEKHARTLFEKSINELIIAQNSADTPKGYDFNYLFYGYVPRISIINMLAYRDSELAYEYLLKSRPKALSHLIVDFNKNPFSFSENIRTGIPLQQDLQLERELKLLIAQKNPSRAIKFINDDLRYGIKEDTLKLLKSLYEFDPVTANELTEKAVEKLLSIELYDSETKKLTRHGIHYNYMEAMSFLSALGKDTPSDFYPMNVSNETLKKLADKISKHLVKRDFDTGNIYALRTIQRFFPNRVDEIEQRKAQISENPRAKENLIYKKLIETNRSNEELLKMAESLSCSHQNQIYINVACRLANEEKFAQAERLLNEKHSDKNYVKNQLIQIFNTLALKAIYEKRFSYAEIAINQIPSAQWRSQTYVLLAGEMYKDNPQKNTLKASLLLAKAELEIEQNSQDRNKFVDIAKTLSGYSIVNQDKAFKNLDLFIDQINVYVKKKLESQNPHPLNVIDGEILLYEFGSDFNLDETITNLKKKDYLETIKIINKFQRPELRISHKFLLFQNKTHSITSLMFNSQVCREHIFEK